MSQAIDATVHTAALAGLESAVNRALALAPEGAQQLSLLSGHIFAIHCTAPELEVQIHILEQGIRLTRFNEGEVTTTVTGSASDFTELAGSADPTATLINGGLALEGDSAALIELQKITSQLEVDWEAPLVTTLGDVAGHRLAQLLRGTLSWGREAVDSFARQLDEFIHEEARLSPPRLELEDFYTDIRTLEQKVERLESRSARARAQLEKLRS